MSQSYFYEIEAEWINGKDLRLSSSELPAISGGAPPEFDGRKENWSPEHLFVASMNSCYALTLLAIVEFSKIPVVSLSCTARGKLEKTAAGYQVTEIIVKPRVVIASAGDLTRMPRILEKAKENCFISNSIKSTITIEPEVFHKQNPAAPCALGSPGV
jgi:peroxiredoxin-like protein